MTPQEDDIIYFDPEKEYTQAYMDSLIAELRVAKSKRIEVSEFKKMLESNDELIGWSYYYFGKSVTNYLKKQYDSSLYYADIGIEIYEKSEVKRDIDLHDQLLLHYYKGESYTNLNKYADAIVSFQRAWDISKIQPYKFESFIVAGIASNHYRLGNDSLSLVYYRITETDSSFMQFPRAAASAYSRIGSLYEKKEDFDIAGKYYKKAIKVGDTTGEKVLMSEPYGMLGALFHKREMIDSAVFYFEKAQLMIDEYGLSYYYDLEHQRVSDYYKGYLELQDGKLDEGIATLEVLMKQMDSLAKITRPDKELMEQVATTLGTAYQDRGNSGKYQELIETSNGFLNRFYEEQFAADLNDLEVQYQTKEKDASIARLEESKRQQQIITISLVGLVILLAAVGYLFLRQRRLRTQYEKENIEQRLLRSQMNPHFLFNALNNVVGLASVKSEKTVPYTLKLSSLLRLILQNSREEMVSLKDELQSVMDYLELESDFSKKFRYTVNLNDEIDPEEVFIPPMFIQPFIENSIKHGFEGEPEDEVNLTISMDASKHVLVCEIQDNGKGYSNTVNMETKDGYKSLSGDILKERLAIYDKRYKGQTHFTISDMNGSGSGTLVNLYLPYEMEE